MKRHKVKTHHWIKGQLQTFEYEFADLMEAMNFIIRNRQRNAKVYDEQGLLVHSVTNGSIDDIYA